MHKSERVHSSPKASSVSDTERQYYWLIRAISDYVCSVDVREGRAICTRHSPQCIAITGYSPDDFAQDPLLWIRIVELEDRPLVIRQAEEILCGAGAPPVEHRIRRKDGQVRWVLNTPIPFKDGKGELIRYDAVIRDVHDRARLREHSRIVTSGVIQFCETHGAFQTERDDITELLEDDLLQLLTAARFRMEALAAELLSEAEFSEALRDVNDLLTQCGYKARMIARKMANVSIAGNE